MARSLPATREGTRPGTARSLVGLIISGANSKRQPELATFREKIGTAIYHMPLSSRLEMNDQTDRLSVAFNTFFTELYVEPPSDEELKFHFAISGKGRPYNPYQTPPRKPSNTQSAHSPSLHI